MSGKVDTGMVRAHVGTHWHAMERRELREQVFALCDEIDRLRAELVEARRESALAQREYKEIQEQERHYEKRILTQAKQIWRLEKERENDIQMYKLCQLQRDERIAENARLRAICAALREAVGSNDPARSCGCDTTRPGAADLEDLARQALKALDERKDEDPAVWARRLAESTLRPGAAAKCEREFLQSRSALNPDDWTEENEVQNAANRIRARLAELEK